MTGQLLLVGLLMYFLEVLTLCRLYPWPGSTKFAPKSGSKKSPQKVTPHQNLIPLQVLVYALALWVKFSADDILKYFSYFSQKTGLDISCKLSPLETICMKCHILFSGKYKKNISKCRLLKMPREWWRLRMFLIFFLLRHKNLQFMYSLESLCWDSSNEYPLYMCLGRIIIKCSSLTSQLMMQSL